MKFATAKEHRDFFEKQGWIEFEDLLPLDQFSLAKEAIDRVLGERMNISQKKVPLASSEKLFKNGRDLWRNAPDLRKIVESRRFGEIAGELFERKTLRFGYDQFFPHVQSQPPHVFSKEESNYLNFLNQEAPLEALSCLKEVAGAMIFALGDERGEKSIDSDSSIKIDIFPKKAGHVVFFKPTLLVDWKAIHRHCGQSFYMVVYALPTSRYYLEPRDPHTHELKRLGYVFNDKLSDKFHPYVFRST